MRLPENYPSAEEREAECEESLADTLERLEVEAQLEEEDGDALDVADRLNDALRDIMSGEA